MYALIFFPVYLHVVALIIILQCNLTLRRLTVCIFLVQSFPVKHFPKHKAILTKVTNHIILTEMEDTSENPNLCNHRNPYHWVGYLSQYRSKNWLLFPENSFRLESPCSFHKCSSWNYKICAHKNQAFHLYIQILFRTLQMH